jgi:hypothetical protein
MPVRSSHITVCSYHACKKLADCYESFLQAWQENIVMWELLTGMTGADYYVRASYMYDRSRLLCESFLQADKIGLKKNQSNKYLPK